MEELKIGDVVWLYDDTIDKWMEFIIMCEDDLEMVLTEYKDKIRYDNREKIQD